VPRCLPSGWRGGGGGGGGGGGEGHLNALVPQQSCIRDGRDVWKDQSDVGKDRTTNVRSPLLVGLEARNKLEADRRYQR